MKKTKKQIEDQKRLDYFAGLIIQGLITNNVNEYVSSNKIDNYCNLSKRIAINLINKLDNEQI
jgi:hypothetical protein